MKLDFRILGPLEVVADGAPIELRGRKERALLAVLLLRANEIVPADVLIEELWGGAPPDTAANTLQVYVSHVRKALAVENGILTTRGPGYCLSVAPEQFDLHTFERLVDEGRAALANEDYARATDALDAALALWRGAPLADLMYEPFAAAEVARLEELRLAATEDRIDAALAGGDHARLVPELEALVAQHPLRERLRAQLMLALYRNGRQADALNEYQRARTTLADELGLEPGEALRQLEQSILNHDPSLAVPTSTPTAPPLPTPPTPLVGRAEELEEAVGLARRDDVRLVTFTGPGGIGKTRLALEVARELGADAFVDLTPVREPELVASAIVTALGLGGGTRPPLETLEEHFQRRASVVLLDNMEQVVDAAPTLARLLAAAPTLKLLVTSRIVLRLSGEHEFPVPPLAHGPAVQLFAHRAEAVDPSFALTAESAGAVAEIAARLEGVPLAIELAAARTRLLPPAALLERLARSLDVLAAGPRDAPKRQQTLRGTLDWSYELLDESEQVLFARVGVFIGGCDLDAVEAVCGASSLELLESLVDKSLIRRGRGSRPRFVMLEIVREYALERLGDDGGADGVRERHARFFAEFADEAETAIEGPLQAQWLERLEADHANLRAAIEWGLSNDPALALQIAGALRRFWHVHGHLDAGLPLYDAALAAAENAPPDERVRALIGAGILSGEKGEFARARDYFERGLVVAKELGDPHRIASCLANLGNLAFFDRDFDRARSLYSEALDLRRNAGITRGVDVLLSNLGLVALSAGELDEAERLLDESLENAEREGGRHTVGASLRALARVKLARGDVPAARALLQRSFDIVEEIGQPFGLAETIDVAAMLAAAEEDPRRAARLFGAAEGIRASIGAEQAPEVREAAEQALRRVADELGAAEFEREREAGFALDGASAVRLSITSTNTFD